MRVLPFPSEESVSHWPEDDPRNELPDFLRKVPIDPAYWPIVIVGLGLTLGVLIGWKVKRQ